MCCRGITVRSMLDKKKKKKIDKHIKISNVPVPCYVYKVICYTHGTSVVSISYLLPQPFYYASEMKKIKWLSQKGKEATLIQKSFRDGTFDPQEYSSAAIKASSPDFEQFKPENFRKFIKKIAIIFLRDLNCKFYFCLSNFILMLVRLFCKDQTLGTTSSFNFDSVHDFDAEATPPPSTHSSY